MLLSVVVPCYNEEAVILETHRRLSEVLSGMKNLDWEILYVDDGSSDRTPELLGQVQRAEERVRFIRLSRNFGHQIAFSAGLDYAHGEAVVVIDADLQDPPEVIPEMVERWRDGYHVVYGARTCREGETTFKLWTAKIFYRLLNRLSNLKMPVDVGDFRLMDRKVVDALRAMPERDRFLRGMVSWVGFRQIAVLYKRAPRFAGESKYPLLKMIRFAADAVISFSFVPLGLVIWPGGGRIGLAFLGILYGIVL